VQCVECTRLICTTHEEVANVRHAGIYAANMDSVCAHCVQVLHERGEVSGKRPAFPSGIASGVRPMMASWIMQRKRERDVAYADFGRLQRSGGL
jgi:hypothetical protein